MKPSPAKPEIPSRSLGGTFHFDKDGNFVEHIPPTKPRDAHVQEALVDAAADAAKTEAAGVDSTAAHATNESGTRRAKE
ncbi:MAG: hypothetical protein ABIQ70_13030 [Dokdonella sp.]